MISNILNLLTFLLVAVAAIMAAASSPTAKPGRINYVLTAHAKAVATICRVATAKRLCCKTLKHVNSDDPKDLVTAYVSATEASMNKSLSFVAGLRPKYGKDATATACLDVCEKQLNYALDDLKTFQQKAGTEIESLETNYSELMQLVRSVFRYQSGCLDDISDKNLLKVVGDGIAEGKNMSNNALDIFYMLGDIFNGFGFKVNLV